MKHITFLEKKCRFRIREKHVMNSFIGALVPDETMVNLISSELKNLGAEPWLLDGFPRTIAQAEALQKETPVNVVINLDVPFDTIIDRVKGKNYHIPIHVKMLVI